MSQPSRSVSKPWDAYAADLSTLRDREVAASLGGDLTGHEDRVARTTRSIAQDLGLGRSVVDAMTVAARYHDIGKLEIDPVLMRKPGRFEDFERREMETHAERGARILQAVPGIDPMMVDAARYHHERFDGLGYVGLKGDDIPLVARVVAVADVHDALTQARVYKPGIPEAKVLAMMTDAGPAEKPARDAFDPMILRAFVAMRIKDPAFHAEEDRRLGAERVEFPGIEPVDHRAALAEFAASPVPEAAPSSPAPRA